MPGLYRVPGQSRLQSETSKQKWKKKKKKKKRVKVDTQKQSIPPFPPQHCSLLLRTDSEQADGNTKVLTTIQRVLGRLGSITVRIDPTQGNRQKE